MTDERESAEAHFRAALDRLVSSTPLRLPQGSRVTQNNVAREAGRDPTALRKSRYPVLVSEIQGIVAASRMESNGDEQIPANARIATNERWKLRLDEVTLQRDRLASMLSAAEAEILRLANIAPNTGAASGAPDSVVQFRRPSKDDKA